LGLPSVISRDLYYIVPEHGPHGLQDYDVAVYEAKEGETIELTSALGSIAVDESGKPSVHIHVTISLPDHRPASGHLLRGIVGPLAEVFIVSLDVALRRVLDPSIGLPALSA